MTEDTHLWLVTNQASGSNDDQAVAELVDGLAAAGAASARIVDFAAEQSPDLSAAALDKAGVTHLAIFTGDGTLGAVLAQAEGWSGQVLVLPGGTTNLLAKALHGEEVTTEAVLDALGRGTLRAVRRQVIGWSGGKAVCEVLAGPGARWSDVREELRDGNVAGIAQTALDAASASADAESLVLIVEPALGKEEGYSGVRMSPEDKGIAVEGYGIDGVGDYLLQGVALLRRNFREGPRDELGRHPHLLCRSVSGDHIDLMIDGERQSGGSEEEFTLVPLDLNLLALP